LCHACATEADFQIFWEPDFVLLRRDESEKVTGGCVCFPTGWSLAEKQIQKVSIVHGPVPGLNARLGSSVEQFFARLKPGTLPRDRCGVMVVTAVTMDRESGSGGSRTKTVQLVLTEVRCSNRSSGGRAWRNGVPVTRERDPSVPDMGLN